MRATANRGLRLFLNFGSGAGRFGNHGQTDYAAAGDLLTKMTAVFGRQICPGARCITIDWPAWKGAGWVAQNPEIERMMQSHPAATFIELDEGVMWLVGEVLYGRAEEVIIAGDLMVEGLSAALTTPRFTDGMPELQPARIAE